MKRIIINITTPCTSNISEDKSFNKKLWYDIKTKKMIEINGDVGFSYNYSKSELTVLAKEKQNNINKNLKTNYSFLNNIERDFDVDVLGKSRYGNNSILTVEVSDSDKNELCDMLEFNSIEYHYG